MKTLITIASLAAAFAITSMAASAAQIKSKSLKQMTVSANDAVWKLESDEIDKEGDAEFKLKHKPTAGACDVDMSEMDTGLVAGNHKLFWLGYAGEMRKAMPNFKKVDVPADFKPAPGFECNAAQFSPAGAGAPSDTHIVCSSGKGSWQLVTAIRTENKDAAKCLADVNAFLSTVKVNK
jgi:hypothetical protein